MADRIEIRPAGKIRATIRPPGSKSLTNRALVCAALAEGSSTLEGVLDSEDTRVMIDALGRLGIAVNHDATSHRAEVRGSGGRLIAGGAELFAANSGTTMRFLAALVSLGEGTFRLDGTARMRERPIQDLIDALAQLGVDARSELGNGCPPIVIRAAGLPGGEATIRGDVSSQFLSGLLMAAPYARAPVELEVEGALVSEPYVKMTLAVMRAFGVDVDAGDLRHLHVAAPRAYRGHNYTIEPDASAASYFFAAAAITGGEVTVEGLSRDSLQGDVAFVDVLGRMGCEVRETPEGITVVGRPLRGIDVDMNAISDTAQTLGAVAVFAEGPTTIRGIGHIRHKETDRIAALATELRKLGADVEEQDDAISIRPGSLHAAEIDTYDDHRMAMSLALVGLVVPGVTIRDPDCTAKTYPDYFAALERVCGSGGTR